MIPACVTATHSAPTLAANPLPRRSEAAESLTMIPVILYPAFFKAGASALARLPAPTIAISGLLRVSAMPGRIALLADRNA